MAVFLWVVGGLTYGVGRTESEAKERGVEVLKESVKMVLSVSPDLAPILDLDSALTQGVTVEYGFIGGAWPIPGIDPTNLLLRTLGVQVDVAHVAMPAATVPAAQPNVPPVAAEAAPAPSAPPPLPSAPEVETGVASEVPAPVGSPTPVAMPVPVLMPMTPPATTGGA